MLLLLLGVQLATPFDTNLPGQTMLVPSQPRLGFKPERKAYPEILQRPIFAPDRQPMLETMADYSLLGVGIAGPLSTAIVQNGGRMMRVKPGDRLAGWRVGSITTNYLFLELNKERRVLKLDMTHLYAAPKTGDAKPGETRSVAARVGVQ
jgi:hypothetical protein